jgi:serine/threonine-protein kinase
LVSVEGVVKLADFGLARVRTHGTASLTMEGEVKGTLPYLAPELIVGGRASERSDIYGLGAVLYELAVGEPPFVGGNSYELIKKICEGHWDGPPLAEAAKGFPPEFHVLVGAMLSRGPEDRPESALQVQLQLEACGASRRERRRLGALVRQIQGEVHTSTAAQVLPGVHDVAQSEEPRPSTVAQSRKRGRSAALLGALALVSMVGVAGFVASPWGAANPNQVDRRAADGSALSVDPERDALATQFEEHEGSGLLPVDPPKPVTERTGTAPGSAATRPPPEESGRSPAKARAKPERALLRVFADPWGNVWINDEKVGRAPVRRSVRPGTYKVQIGGEYPEEPKYVKVVPGEHRKITLRKAEIE